MSTTPVPRSEIFWSPRGRIPRSTFIGRFLLLLAVFVGTVAWTGDRASLWAGVICITALLLMVVQCVKRARDGLGSGWWAVPVVIPFVGGVALLVLAIVPSRKDQQQPAITESTPVERARAMDKLIQEMK